MKTFPSHSRSKKPVAGFTLLELMIVMTLLALITAMVTPVFSGTFRRIHAENETRNLVSFMEYAQNRSVTDATEYRVYMVPSMNVYWLEKAVMRDGVAIEYVMALDTLAEDTTVSELVALIVPRARQYQGKKVYYVSFYPNGMCDDAIIAMQNLDDESVFFISTAGSRITWMEGDADA